MTHKQMLYDCMARDKLLRCAKALANVVRVTQGPSETIAYMNN